MPDADEIGLSTYVAVAVRCPLEQPRSDIIVGSADDDRDVPGRETGVSDDPVEQFTAAVGETFVSSAAVSDRCDSIAWKAVTSAGTYVVKANTEGGDGSGMWLALAQARDGDTPAVRRLLAGVTSSLADAPSARPTVAELASAL
ncbi:hypothetical protein [Streptomyces sp. UNOC14_S4]|uniref:hypothetical protein n=1 Tax=Streptomyces sp. UNOC14_S4 TaxID=2872340 RepID=UPI001E4FC653|nr:hypothetical protein [Streptomyces sp. UNOC14_S4]MCC3773113.1 hypothetical protein [Streptomyces sp. UNOC14_S4]